MKPFRNPMTTIGSLKINNVSGGASINFGPAFHKGHQANAKIETGEIVIGDEFTINIGCPDEEENEENEEEANNGENNGENDDANDEENDEKEAEYEFEYGEKVDENELEYSEEDEDDHQPKKSDPLRKKKWKWIKGKFMRVD